MGIAPSVVRRDNADRLEVIGWGLLILMSGVLALVPGLPDGTWLVGLGLLILGLNAARLAMGLPLDWFGLVVGSGAILAGLGVIAGLEVPVFALLLIACGLAVIAGQLRQGRAPR